MKEIGSVLTERDCDRERKAGEIKRGREVEKKREEKIMQGKIQADKFNEKFTKMYWSIDDYWQGTDMY